MIFDLFCSCGLDPMIFMYELNPYSLEMYRMCEKFLRQGSRKLSSDRQTDRQTYALEITDARRFAGA